MEGIEEELVDRSSSIHLNDDSSVERIILHFKPPPKPALMSKTVLARHYNCNIKMDMDVERQETNHQLPQKNSQRIIAYLHTVKLFQLKNKGRSNCTPWVTIQKRPNGNDMQTIEGLWQRRMGQASRAAINHILETHQMLQMRLFILKIKLGNLCANESH